MTQVITPASKPRHALIWGDSPHALTGFGRVVKKIINAFPSNWEFTVVGINHPDRLHTESSDPRIKKIIPTSIRSKGSPLGEEIAVSCYRDNLYDVFFIVNDLDVTHSLTKRFNAIKEMYHLTQSKWCPIVYYFPVDGPMLGNVDFLQISDISVTYTDWGHELIKDLLPPNFPVRVIPHGTDTTTFTPLSREIKHRTRRELFHVFNENKFIISNVNNNTQRKDLFQSIQAVRLLINDGVPALLYLHTRTPCDGYDLRCMVRSLNLDYGKDVIFATPELLKASDKKLNEIYNASDCFLTTARREGWGLSATEAASAGCPIVAPNFGPFNENFHDHGGYLYPISSLIWNQHDSRGYGHFGTADTIKDKLHEVYQERGKTPQLHRIAKARQHLSTQTWKKINEQWVGIFNYVTSKEFFSETAQEHLANLRRQFRYVWRT